MRIFSFEYTLKNVSEILLCSGVEEAYRRSTGLEGGCQLSSGLPLYIKRMVSATTTIRRDIFDGNTIA